jgi:PQQ-dependent dehydrogenase (methanol/ethanol family)
MSPKSGGISELGCMNKDMNKDMNKEWTHLALAGAACVCVLSASALGAETAATGAAENLAQAGVDYANARYSTLSQINSENVKDLVPIWTFSTGVLRGHEGAPLAVGDILYVHTPFPNIVYALDLDHEGKILWKYEPKQDSDVISVMCCDTVSRGVAYSQGKIFLYRADATLVALDALTGAKIWSVKNGDPKEGATGTSAPFVVRDEVLVGISGGEFGVRGYLTAYDIKTGKKIWRAYSIGPDSDALIDPVKTTELGKPVGKESSLASWRGDQWKIGGGAPWGSISYDPELNLIYYGTGNPSTWNPKQRPGDNKWAMTIFARDLDTGVARWVYQMTPHDEWDYDGVNEMILTDEVVDGKVRKALTHFDRNGFAYVLERTSGELLSAEKYEPSVDWATKIDMDKNSKTYGRPVVADAYSPDHNGEDATTKEICPSTVGAKNANPAAFSPLTGFFYAPVTHICMDYEPFKVTYSAGQPYTGADTSVYPPKGETAMGGLIAWNAGKTVWSDSEPFAVASGVLATAGGVIFYGALEGYLKAVDARSGKELYKFRTPSGIIGNLMTFEHKGKQFVAVLSGAGGWSGVGLTAGMTRSGEGANSPTVYAALAKYTALGGQLTVFALR